MNLIDVKKQSLKSNK